jgi:cephalosporin hydroxylase
MIKFLLVLWIHGQGLTGFALLDSEHLCKQVLAEQTAFGTCVEINLDTLVHDAVVWPGYENFND